MADAKTYRVPKTAHETLKYAAQLLTGDDDDKRQALDMAVRASLKLFSVDADVKAHEILPLNRLLLALTSRHRGIADPLLKPVNAPPSRAPDSSAIWMTRALIAAALDAQLAMGLNRDEAWREVVRDLHLHAHPIRIAKDQAWQWRNLFKKHLAGHRDGEQYIYWKAYLEHQNRAQSLSDKQQVYLNVIQAALAHWDT